MPFSTLCKPLSSDPCPTITSAFYEYGSRGRGVWGEAYVSASFARRRHGG